MKKLILILSAIALFNVSCDKDEAVIAETGDVIKANVTASEANYNDLIKARVDYKGESFEILEVKRTTNILTVIVEGPCDIDGYNIVWDGVLENKQPVVGKLAVNYVSKSEVQCQAIMKRTIEVDLEKAFGDKYQTNMVVDISNASKVQDFSVDSSGKVIKKN